MGVKRLSFRRLLEERDRYRQKLEQTTDPEERRVAETLLAEIEAEIQHRDPLRRRGPTSGSTGGCGGPESVKPPVHPPIPIPFRLRTARDVLTLLEEQIGALRADETLSTVERARVLGYLARIALKAIEAGDLEARIEALEAVLKRRRSS